MLLSKDAIADVVEVLREADFYRPAHQVIYGAVLDLYGRGEPADAVTVAADLTRTGDIGRVGGAPYLHTLVSMVPTAANANYYGRIVREQAILRRLVEAGTRIVSMGYTGTGDVDDMVDRAQAEVYDVTDRRSSEDYAPLRDIMGGTLNEIEAISNRGGEMVGVPTGFADLDSLTNGLHPGQLIIIAARPAIGKALALDTPIATPSGWTTMGELEVGDFVVGDDGSPVRVSGVTDVMLNRPCFRVTFADGSQIVADAEHEWLTDTRASRKSAQAAAAQYNGYRNQRTFAEIRTTAEIHRTLRCATRDRRLNHSVPNAKALQLPEAQLPLPPYTLGVWLGDGTSAAAHFTSQDPEIAAYVEAEGILAPHLGKLRYGLRLPPAEPVDERSCVVCGTGFVPPEPRVRTCGKSCGGKVKGVRAGDPDPQCPDCGGPVTRMGICQACVHEHGSVQALLRTHGLLGNKHIPQAYLRSSERQRRDLLAGLLDTDGTVTSNGNVQFTSTSKTLADGVFELVVSLGYRCSVSTKRVLGRTEESSTAYNLNFSTHDQVFRLHRKHIAHKERTHHQSQARRTSRFITAVEPVASVPVRCIEVANVSHMYLAGHSMIPTHNSTLGVDIARAASIKHGLASVIFSLEMSRNEIVMRLLSAEAQVPLHHMRSGTMSDADWTKLAGKMGVVSEAPLFIDDSPNMTLMEIRAKCRRLKQRHDLRLVIVDYLQLMTSGKRVESRQQEVSEFSRSLKLLAKELGVPVIAISQLNRGPEQRTDKKPMLSDLRESGCLPASTRIMRADNGTEVTLGELMTSGAKDIPVWALDDSLRYVPSTMTHVFPTGRKEVFRVRTASGRVLEATANHPMLTYGGWQPLGELPVGSRLAIPRHVPAPEQETSDWSDDQAIVLAHMIGDGSVIARQPIRYATKDPANIEVMTTSSTRAFDVRVSRDDYAKARCTTLRFTSLRPVTHGVRNPIAAWMDELGLFDKRSHEKFVPEAVFSLPKRQIALFLRHLWATDGSIQVLRNGRGGRIYYATTSRRLADDVARLLLRFGLNARIRVARKSGYRDSYHVDISGAADQKVFLRRIGSHGERGLMGARLLAILETVSENTNRDTVPREIWDDVREVIANKGMTHREFAAAMGTQFCGSTMWKHSPSRERLAKVAQVLNNADLEMIATNDVYWDEIVSVESVGEQEVFDATVLGRHNFVADGVVVHNSLEQDADMVVLLHREDAYERESPRAGEADFIVAKHRNGPTATVTVAFQGHYSRFVDMAQA
ncbi:MAG: replicative DNA helicase [Actinobacteria bacterium]|nr:replicative DNA helicase [Actinomycetota bacterium]